VSKPNPGSGFDPCGCTGRGKPVGRDHGLYYLTAAVERMNARPAVADVEPEPEDERHWVRQVPDRADLP
jgi:hypothetical protein